MPGTTQLRTRDPPRAPGREEQGIRWHVGWTTLSEEGYCALSGRRLQALDVTEEAAGQLEVLNILELLVGYCRWTWVTRVGKGFLCQLEDVGSGRPSAECLGGGEPFRHSMKSRESKWTMVNP